MGITVDKQRVDSITNDNTFNRSTGRDARESIDEKEISSKPLYRSSFVISYFGQKRIFTHVSYVYRIVNMHLTN